MGNDDDRRLDDELRRRARNASERHSGSIEPAETDRALALVRSGLDDESRGDAVAQKRNGWLLAAAAGVVVAVLAAGAAWWPVGESDELVTSVSVSELFVDDVSEVASTSTAVVDVPSVVFDADGNEVATFRLVNGRTVIEPDPTAFTETLLDYLLNRSTILGDTVSERKDALVSGGLRIHTTADPGLQQAAERARDELPRNDAGIDAAIVSIDTSTGAVRAIVSGDESVPDGRQINMALAPRQPGSAVDPFVLAAALQAGAQPDDLIDGRRGCVLPGPWSDPETGATNESYLQINGGTAGFVGSIRDSVARSIRCSRARLAHIVGLERVVDTTYRMAESPYLFRGQSLDVREPIDPVTSFGLGSNPMSPLDMASGMQTIANGGVHHPPHFVEFVVDAEGARQYAHEPAPMAVLDPDVALDAIDVLKGPMIYGTGRRHALGDGRTAIGKTGTKEDNTDAWFIGATPQLTTAVWVGDPVALTPMIAIPEFLAVDVSRVQGGTFPGQIWKAFTDAALADTPIEDWEPAAPPDRPNARLVLPGYECVVLEGSDLVQLVPAEIGTTVPPGETDPTFPIPSVALDVLSAGCN